MWPQLTFLEKHVLSFSPSLPSWRVSTISTEGQPKHPLTPEPVGTWEFQPEHVGPQRPLFRCKKSLTTKDKGEAGGGARNGLGREGMRELAASQQPPRTDWGSLISNQGSSSVPHAGGPHQPRHSLPGCETQLSRSPRSA